MAISDYSRRARFTRRKFRGPFRLPPLLFLHRWQRYFRSYKICEQDEREKKRKKIITWTRDSGRLILRATSSRIKMSGYLVFENSPSSTSSWALVKVVLSRRCLRWFIPATWGKEALVINYYVHKSQREILFWHVSDPHYYVTLSKLLRSVQKK